VSIIVVLAAIFVFGIGLTVHLRGRSFAAGLLMSAIAVRTFLSRFQLLLDDHDVFTGMRYGDDHVSAISLMATTIALLLAAAILLANRAGTLRTAAVGIALPVLVHFVGGGLIPWYVSTFVVRPNALVLERPYI